ncbi:pyruvate carboxylase [Ferroacidibacillus organovorans]|uniref:Pyruvate carboxylase n=1 Tax=Ferroacidibacillus organovorans TaxID=1765683 RepID=A0A853KDG5_9BACL|nr:pyruvate carboxylase [Ferroacidibacillus organovorans]KYP80200.1 pyruvate carboxylase [Ferroacidibacillus organovorans]OAG95076.1 pyruvate carboxylase [Ferroacidibacillus organovorans]
MKFKKVLVANRGEIAIRICRACTELNIRTVAIYSKEDSLALHRYKADEAYLVGANKAPVEAYLDIPGILDIAKRHECDAIHPGYGFLSENATFARACEEAGIVFIGPTPEHLEMFGDKVTARLKAMEANVPVVPGSKGPVSLQEAREFADEFGYPLMVKAVSGGGGRGMRAVTNHTELEEAYSRAQSEAQTAFGAASLYVEKLVDNPKHIEVQILGDAQGNIVHLYERDCSVQRRHQKVIEVAPSLLPEEKRMMICETALRLMKSVNYKNAGTVEFLLGADGALYFIEVNPRVQVEHTITELVTGIDIVQAQLLIAQDVPMSDPQIGIERQESIVCRGFAIQSRVTTEDPQNNFLPDTGRITAYRTGGGFGVRLDGGNGFSGARILPYYDSMLEKVSVWSLRFDGAIDKMSRALAEFRIRGVKTNIPFLDNVIHHSEFRSGRYTVRLIEDHPELFIFRKRQDRATKLLQYISNVTVNGSEGIKHGVKKPTVRLPSFPTYRYDDKPKPGTRDVLLAEGVDGLLRMMKQSKQLWLTDTTLRDAHQSLLATRMRTYDLVRIADVIAHETTGYFSLEMWGGATFDTSMRFLKEDPWERLAVLRERIPNILFQMLLRGANAVGYKNYPDNVVNHFIDEAAMAGIDVFRIFDSLNWVPNMAGSIERVRHNGMIAEAAICYTGDLLDEKRTKFNLAYYVDLAKQLEQAGATILAIKDMAGLLKPQAAHLLVKTLKEHVGLPIHLHTHDTAGTGVATILQAVEAGLDIADVALSSMSGQTSQPSSSAVVASLMNTARDTHLDLSALRVQSDYFSAIREWYQPFESGLQAGAADVYEHEMPGGQYTNLQKQAESLGLGGRFDEVKRAYREVNDLLGDIVKVTPSSKMVGDFALFLVQNRISAQELERRAHELDYPASVVDYFSGHMGQPFGGFPTWLQEAVLKGRKALKERPGAGLPAVDFGQLAAELKEKTGRICTEQDVISYALYGQVYVDFSVAQNRYSNLSVLDTGTFFYGLRPGEEAIVEIDRGKTLMIRLISVSAPRPDGTRVVFYELNGQPREVEVIDQQEAVSAKGRRKANPSNLKEVGASMSGTVISLMVEEGDHVVAGQYLLVTEAMKMEMQVQAPRDGLVEQIAVSVGDSVSAGDLLFILE